MSCNDILHYFHINSVFVILMLNCSYKKDLLIELLRLFYDIPVAEVMCNVRMDLRKLSEDVYDCNNGNNSQNLCTFITISCSHSSIHFLH